METTLLHIFRNTPMGRETLLQSLYFCNQISAVPIVYIPITTKFLMYFENDVVQIDLDKSYLTSPKTAVAHATELIEQHHLTARFIEPKSFTASSLPDIPTDFDFMGCPRSISDFTSKIGLGYIGPRVRRIAKSARFPVLIGTQVFKEWKSIAVFFGGSDNAVAALKLGFRIQRASGMPMNVYSHLGKSSKSILHQSIQAANIESDMANHVNKWHTFRKGRFVENLYQVPHDALVIVGAFGHGVLKDILFGSKMEKIQSTLPNNILIAGPNYTQR